PRLPNVSTSLKCSPIFVAANTAPNAPPAPMITKMPPAFSAASCNSLLTVSFFHDRLQLNASKTPIDNAITGSPGEEKILSQPPAADFSITKKDFTAIKIIGITTGRNAFITEGGLD